jgi:protoporphyrinogen/coproporphyrinogen III oxidase
VRGRIAVVGGGITGLAAAHRLVERGVGEVTLLEAGERLGGVLSTERTGGFTIENGADAILSEKPDAVALCERLGVPLVGTNDTDRRTYVVHEGALAPLPEGFLLLAPTNLSALAASPLFSWRGKLRMGLDLVLPRAKAAADESLGSFVRRRLGREALERVAQPLAAGIYTADVDKLSLAATLPRFRDIEVRYRSVILGLRARSGNTRESGARYSLFVAPTAGMGALVDALAQRLPEGVARLRTPVTELAREAGRWHLITGGNRLSVDGVVVATPAYTASVLLAPVDAELARLLAAIDYASSATVTFAYRAAELPPLAGFGFVVPAAEGRDLLACTWSSRKFPGRAPTGHDLLRAFVGGALRPDLVERDDGALVEIVRRELEALAGIGAAPDIVRVQRHRRAMPQYAVGHLERVAAIDRRVAALPGLALAGSAYRGVGIPDCVRGGEAAAEAVLGAASIATG